MKNRDFINTGKIILAAVAIVGGISTAMATTIISNLNVKNSTGQGGTGHIYVIQQAGFVSGAVQYVDRSYDIASPVPSAVNGQTYILTALGDQHVDEGDSNVMNIKVGQSSTVYVGVDTRVSIRPTWLTANFLDTNTSFVSNSVTFELFVNIYPNAATVTLGGEHFVFGRYSSPHVLGSGRSYGSRHTGAYCSGITSDIMFERTCRRT